LVLVAGKVVHYINASFEGEDDFDGSRGTDPLTSVGSAAEEPTAPPSAYEAMPADDDDKPDVYLAIPDEEEDDGDGLFDNYGEDDAAPRDVQPPELTPVGLYLLDLRFASPAIKHGCFVCSFSFAVRILAFTRCGRSNLTRLGEYVHAIVTVEGVTRVEDLQALSADGFEAFATRVDLKLGHQRKLAKSLGLLSQMKKTRLDGPSPSDESAKQAAAAVAGVLEVTGIGVSGPPPKTSISACELEVMR